MIGIACLVLAAATADPLGEAAKALTAGRDIQAGMLISAARDSGATGEPIDRLTADQALASGDNSRALTLYRGLLVAHPDEALLLERAGEAALRLGDEAGATALLDRATRQPNASWHAWSLAGIAADRRRDFAAADAAYARADGLAPNQATVADNRGWSLMLRGRWAEAADAFQSALLLDPAVPHGAANLELARAALAVDLPAKASGEADNAFAARLNDAGVVAIVQGDRPRAIAAFSRAIAAHSNWFARAAQNLDLAEHAAP